MPQARQSRRPGSWCRCTRRGRPARCRPGAAPCTRRASGRRATPRRCAGRHTACWRCCGGSCPDQRQPPGFVPRATCVAADEVCPARRRPSPSRAGAPSFATMSACSCAVSSRARCSWRRPRAPVPCWAPPAARSLRRPTSPARSSRRTSCSPTTSRSCATTPRPSPSPSTPDTVVPGRYGVWLDGGAGHARVGEIVGADAHVGDAPARRRRPRTDRRPGPARWNQYYYWDRPSVSLGLPDEDVSILSDVGPLPGWLVRPEAGCRERLGGARARPGRAQGGDAPRRPGAARAGWTSLVTAYRNDRGRPAGSGRPLQPRAVRVARRRGRHGLRRVARRATHPPARVVDGRRHRAPGARPLAAVGPRRRRGARLPGHRLGRRAAPPRRDCTRCPARSSGWRPT